MVRFILDKHSRSHIGQDELNKISMLKVADRVSQLKLNHAFKIFNGTSPQYLGHFFSKTQSLHSFNTRNSDGNFHVPNVKGPAINTFFYTAIKDWNALPTKVKKSSSLSSFKILCKQFLTSRASTVESNDFVYY